MSPRRLRVDPAAPDTALIALAADVILGGGVVALPTDTLYGLAVDPFNTTAVDRLFAIKGRGANQPIALIAGDVDQVVATFSALSPAAAALAGRFWPGPLTLLLAAPAGIAAGVASADGKVGVRIPDHGVARALCLRGRRALTATSANRSGQPAASDADAVERDLGGDLDLILDGGPTRGGEPSTVVDVAEGGLRLVRPGAIPWDAVTAAAR